MTQTVELDLNNQKGKKRFNQTQLFKLFLICKKGRKKYFRLVTAIKNKLLQINGINTSCIFYTGQRFIKTDFKKNLLEIKKQFC